MRNILDFEKNIADLQDKITKLRESGSDKSSLIEVNEQIEQIKLKIDKKLSEIYKNLTPWHKLQVARHHNRPHFLDYLKILVPDFLSEEILNLNFSVLKGASLSLNH